MPRSNPPREKEHVVTAKTPGCKKPHNEELLEAGPCTTISDGTFYVEVRLSDAKADHDAVFWALVVAVYHLEQLQDEGAQVDIDRMRAILSEFPPKAVSVYFLKAALAFNPPETLEQAQALYDHYGVEAVGLEKTYPERKPQ